MDTVVFDGVAYVKASTLAKRFRYTTDYIGQLCRSGKVDARLVGRSWYVNEAALIAHKEARYQPTRSDEKISKIKVFEDISADVSTTKVHPRLTRVTSKLVVQPSETPAKKNFASRLAFTPARYEPDEADLLPQPVTKHTNQKPQELPIEPAESKKIRIATVETVTEPLAFTEVPEVSLSGELHIKSLDYSPEDQDAPLVTVQDFPSVEPPKEPLHEDMSVSVDTRHTERPLSRPVTALKPVRFSPTIVPVTDGSTGAFSSFLSVTVVVFGLGLFILLTMTTHVLVVEGGQLRSVVDFNLANVYSIWSLLD